MLNRVLEIADENRYISLDRGFIVIKQGTETLGSVPLDDIAVLLLSAQSITFSKNILNELSERGCITILCGKNYIPKSIVIPIANHSFFTKIVKSQIKASEPLKKRIWQQIIIEKIKNQAKALKYCKKEKEAKLIENISKLVKSGDPDNREAYAARMYWKYLFGNDFIRDKDGKGINSLLNYGYAIIRASMTRAICAHGLIPSLGIHHDNNLNPFCLADDLFELFRPIVDIAVFKITKNDSLELIPENKKTLVSLLNVKIHIKEGITTCNQSMHYIVNSYVRALENGKPVIELPNWKGDTDGITLIE